jgi:hypothetical protein
MLRAASSLARPVRRLSLPSSSSLVNAVPRQVTHLQTVRLRHEQRQSAFADDLADEPWRRRSVGHSAVKNNVSVSQLNAMPNGSSPSQGRSGNGLALPFAPTPREILDSLPELSVTARFIALDLDVGK